MEIQIYFTTEINLKAEGAIEQIMLNTVENYRNQNIPDYIAKANTDIETNDAAQREITKLINDKPIKMNSFEYNSLIEAQPIEYGSHARHIFNIHLKIKSVKYNCVKIIDATHFLCYTNEDSELRLIVKPNNYKVLMVKND